MLVKLSKITHWYLTLTYKRFHMNPFLAEKRMWNSYPNKTFKTFKVYEIILNKRWGKLWQKTSLKLFTFRTLKILWFNRFRRKKHTCMYCQIRFGILYCSAVFFMLFLSNISSRIILKWKSHGRRNKTPRYLRLKTCRKFPQKREHQTSTSLRARRARSLFWGSREKSRESSARKVTLARAAEWEARSLAPSFAF